MSCWFIYIYISRPFHMNVNVEGKKNKGHGEVEPVKILQEEKCKNMIMTSKDSTAGSRLCIVRRSDWDVLFSGSKDAANGSVIKSCSRQMGPDGAGSRSFRRCYWRGVPKLFHSTDPQNSISWETGPPFAIKHTLQRHLLISMGF